MPWLRASAQVMRPLPLSSYSLRASAEQLSASVKVSALSSSHTMPLRSRPYTDKLGGCCKQGLYRGFAPLHKRCAHRRHHHTRADRNTHRHIRCHRLLLVYKWINWVMLQTGAMPWCSASAQEMRPSPSTSYSLSASESLVLGVADAQSINSISTEEQAESMRSSASASGGQ